MTGSGANLAPGTPPLRPPEVGLLLEAWSLGARRVVHVVQDAAGICLRCGIDQSGIAGSGRYGWCGDQLTSGVVVGGGPNHA